MLGGLEVGIGSEDVMTIQGEQVIILRPDVPSAGTNSSRGDTTLDRRSTSSKAGGEGEEDGEDLE